MEDMSEEYLYCFGYESPTERETNARAGTDFESSAAIRIEAESEEQALEWGMEISERFVKALFGEENVSWRAERFAAFIENDPDVLDRWRESLPKVTVGEYPNFDTL
jgi:hypothetical protein